MDNVFLVYKTNTWHHHDSRELIGVVTTKLQAIDICKQRATKEGEEIEEHDLYLLDTIQQTQNYSQGEFLFEEQPVNQLI